MISYTLTILNNIKPAAHNALFPAGSLAI